MKTTDLIIEYSRHKLADDFIVADFSINLPTDLSEASVFLVWHNSLNVLYARW